MFPCASQRPAPASMTVLLWQPVQGFCPLETLVACDPQPNGRAQSALGLRSGVGSTPRPQAPLDLLVKSDPVPTADGLPLRPCFVPAPAAATELVSSAGTSVVLCRLDRECEGQHQLSGSKAGSRQLFWGALCLTKPQLAACCIHGNLH